MESQREDPTLGRFLRRTFSYLRPFKLACVLILLTMLVELSFSTAFPVSLKILIDDAIRPANERLLIGLIIGLAAFAILASLASLAQDYLYARVGAELLNDLRVKMFHHLQQLSMDYYAKTRVGDVMSRFSTDLASVENAVILALPASVLSVLSIVMTLAVMVYLEWRLALLSLLTVPLSIVGPRLISPRAASVNILLKDQLGSLANTVQENVSAQPVVKAFCLEGSLERDFKNQSDALVRISRRANFLNYFMEWTANKTILLLTVAIISTGAMLAFRHEITIGELVAFQGLFIRLSQSVCGLTWTLPHLMQGAAGMQRIDELLEQTPSVTDAPNAVKLPCPSKAIAFDNVTFGYTPEQTNLSDVSINIPVGSTAAFVGPSGAGKSTVLNLIMRFYDPQHGRVLFDGVDARDVSLASLRSNIGTVFQDNFLFNTTIRENVRMGRPEADDEEVEAAARQADIHELIVSLPQGYDTPAGERGSRFSGGQRQRLAIARALLRNPAVLLLDEATSALDPATEHDINQTIRKIGQERTLVAVTHRLGPVSDFDRIFVLEEGRLVEQGRHAELLAQQGVYAGLWAKQSGFTISSDGDHVDVAASRLRAIPLLSQLQDELLEELTGDFVMERSVAERVVVREGDPGDKFYIIVRGRVAVTRENSGKRPISVLQDGDYFGEIALLKDVPRTATIRTEADSIFLTLQRGKFSRLLERSPDVRAALEQAYALRMGSW